MEKLNEKEFDYRYESPAMCRRLMMKVNELIDEIQELKGQVKPSGQRKASKKTS